MRRSCPYCDSKKGFYRVEQARLIQHFDWDGNEEDTDIDEITYVGSKLKCSQCQEVVTSFVKGLHRDLANE